MRLLNIPLIPGVIWSLENESQILDKENWLDWVLQPNEWSQDCERLLRVFHWHESTESLKWSMLASVLAQLVHIIAIYQGLTVQCPLSPLFYIQVLGSRPDWLCLYFKTIFYSLSICFIWEPLEEMQHRSSFDDKWI